MVANKMYNKCMNTPAPSQRNGGTGNGQARGLWLGLAYVSLGMGAAGAVLPVLPTTPFVLLALWAGARSSPRLRFRLYRHPRYGATLRAWHRHGVIPASAKAAACGVMLASTVVLMLTGAPHWLLLAVLALFAAVAGFTLTRPSRPPDKVSPRT